MHEATHTDAIKQKILAKTEDAGTAFDPMHSSVKEVAEFAEGARLPVLMLTHFSARFAPHDDPDDVKPNMGHVRMEAERYYQGRCILTQDFIQVLVDTDGVVSSDSATMS